MTTWEQILLGIGALLVLLVFWPGVKATLERSRLAEQPDWQGVLLPIGAVILFVVLLILLVKA